MGRKKIYLTEIDKKEANKVKSKKYYDKNKIPNIFDIEINLLVKSNLGLYKKHGIYKISNNLTNKFYIGSAVNLSKRIFCEHIKTLNKNNHYNKKLQTDWNRFGGDSFSIHIIEFVSKKGLLIEREQFYLNKLLFANINNDEFYRLGYNLCREAGSLLGFKMSDETKLKIGLANKGKKYFGIKNPFYGKKHTQESIKKIIKNNGMKGQPSPRRKKILQYTIDDKFVKEWNYVLEAENFYNNKHNKKYKGLISSCCNNKIKLAYGYKWKFKK